MIYFYNFLLVLFLPIWLMLLASKGKKDKKYFSFWSERLGFFKNFKQSFFWIHAVSVGEVMAASALIDRVLVEYPNRRIVISVTTPTGRARLQSLYSNNERVTYCYLPYDIVFFIKNFIKTFQPSMLIILETEIWPSMLYVANAKGIKILLANGRMSEKSFRGYSKYPRLVKSSLNKINLIAAQYEHDEKHFSLLCGNRGSNIVTLGNLKYDLVTNAKNKSVVREDGVVTIMAACTHSDEEQQILSVYKNLRSKFNSLRLIIAPRHIHRCKDIISYLESCMPNVSYTSLSKSGDIDSDVLFIDKMGVLAEFYQKSDIVFIGGSMVDKGGQSPLEAAVFGKPVLMGPSFYNFEHVTKSMNKDGGIIIVNDVSSLELELTSLILNKDIRDKIGSSAAQHVLSNRGSADLHMECIRRLLLECVEV